MGRLPPPIIRAMANRKRFFSIDLFPNSGLTLPRRTTSCQIADSRSDPLSGLKKMPIPPSIILGVSFKGYENIFLFWPRIGKGQAIKKDERIFGNIPNDPPHFRKLCYKYSTKMSEEALYKGPKSATKIYGLKMTSLSPLWKFSDNSSVLVAWPMGIVYKIIAKSTTDPGVDCFDQ